MKFNAEKLKSLRNQSKFTQKELASKVGISVSQLSKIENGATPNLATSLKIANFFHLTPDSFTDKWGESVIQSSSWQKKIDDLMLDHTLARIQEKLPALESRTEVNFGRLFRFIKIFNKLRVILPQANSQDTSLRTFETISRALDSIRKEFDMVNGPDLIDYTVVDSCTDILIDVMPLIKVTESVSLYADERKKETENKFRELATFFDKSKEDVNEALSNIKELELEGKTLSQLLAGRVLNDYFEKRAKEEKTSAFRWTIATWVFAVLTIGALVGIFILTAFYLNIPNQEFNLQLLGTKILITATLGFVAKWTSKRANRHLMEEAKYHRLAVNMATLTSFIAPLNEEGRAAVISAVAINTFTETSGNETKTDFETASASDLVSKFLPKVEK